MDAPVPFRLSGDRMSRQIDYYFSFSSPWAYIGHKAFRDVVATYDLKVNHKPVVLVELFSETGGLPLIKRHPVRQRYRMVELQRWRDRRGLTFHLQPANWPFNARLADGVVVAAIEAGHDPDPFLRRAFAAVWEDELNLADAATLVRLADASGLPGSALAERSINIRAITTSEIKFSLLIDAAFTELAVRTLHSLYGLDKTAP